MEGQEVVNVALEWDRLPVHMFVAHDHELGNMYTLRGGDLDSAYAPVIRPALPQGQASLSLVSLRGELWKKRYRKTLLHPGSNPDPLA